MRWAVCAVGRLVICAVGGLRGGRFARLAVFAVGSFRGWRFSRLAVFAVGVFAVARKPPTAQTTIYPSIYIINYVASVRRMSVRPCVCHGQVQVRCMF